MRKIPIAALLALGVSSGCVTSLVVNDVEQKQQRHEDGTAAVEAITLFPLAFLADVALLPLYVVGAPVAIPLALEFGRAAAGGPPR